MAEETATVQAAASPATADAPRQVIKYTVDELKTAAKKQFGCGPEVIDGAIYGKEETSYSVDEMKTLIDAFLKKPIKDGDE